MATILQIQRALTGAAREQDAIKKALAPSIALAQALNTLDPPYLRSVRDFVSAMQRHDALFTEMTRMPKALEDVVRQMRASRAFIDDIVSGYATMRESLRHQFSILESLSTSVGTIDKIKLTIPQFSRSAFAWECAALGLTNRMHEIGLVAQREALANRLIAAPMAYTEFVQRTTDRLVKTASEEIASALRGSLNLAEHQLLSISGTLSNFLIIPAEEDEPSGIRPLRAPFFQRDELLTRETVEDEEDLELLTSASETAGLVELSKEVLNLVTICNEASKTSIGKEIFKPTTRLLEVFADFPWLVATDRKELADIVDCLYFIFYEGAGKDKLRFMTKHGGPLDDNDCDFIWCIKHLRNKWTRHDADHGEDKDIQKSWKDLAAKFIWLDLSEHPTEARHFRHLHGRLLEESKEFLKLIQRKLVIRQ